MMRWRMRLLRVVAWAAMLGPATIAVAGIVEEGDASCAILDFAIQRWNPDQPSEVRIVRDATLPAQGFVIERGADGGWSLRGADDHGLMYGLLDLAEILRLRLNPAKRAAPKIHRWGMKFNIPLDARCPSYDDFGTSAVRNIPEMWDRTFWRGFLDSLPSYYADKLRGSTEVHRFRVTGESEARADAIEHLERAVEHWEAYGQVASSLYDPQLLARVNTTDWLGLLLQKARADLEIARNARPGVFPASVPHSNLPPSMR